MIQAFNTKSFTVNAIQFSGENISEIVSFTQGESLNQGKNSWLTLKTKSGILTIHIGNFVVLHNDLEIEVFSANKFLRFFTAEF